MWNLKVNNKDTRTTSLTSLWCLYIDFEQNLHIILVFPLLAFCSGISIIDFEQVNAGWISGSSAFRKIPNRKNFMKLQGNACNGVLIWVKLRAFIDL